MNRPAFSFDQFSVLADSEADYAVLIDSGVPRSATAPAQLALDRAIAAETGGGRDDEHQLRYVALTRARYAALIVVSDPEAAPRR